MTRKSSTRGAAIVRLAGACLLALAYVGGTHAAEAAVASQRVTVALDGDMATVTAVFTLEAPGTHEAPTLDVSMLALDGTRIVDAWLEGPDLDGRRRVTFAAERPPSHRATVQFPRAPRTFTLTMRIDGARRSTSAHAAGMPADDATDVWTVPVPVLDRPLTLGGGDGFAVEIAAPPAGTIVRPFPSHLRRRSDGTIAATLPVAPAFVRVGFRQGGGLTLERAADLAAMALLLGLGAVGARALLVRRSASGSTP